MENKITCRYPASNSRFLGFPFKSTLSRQITNLIYSNYTLPSFAGDDGNKKLAIPCVLGYGLPEGGIRLFSELSRAALGLTHSYTYNRSRGSSPGAKRLGRDVDHPPPLMHTPPWPKEGHT